MTASQLREWSLKNNQPDQWWLSLDAVTEEIPVTIAEIEERVRSGEYTAFQVLHVSQAQLVDPVWTDFELPTPPRLPVANVVTMEATSHPQGCPHCGSFEHYQKVSVLFSMETSTISVNTTGMAIGMSGSGLGLGVGGGSSRGIQQSLLGQRLAPPKAPTNDGTTFMIIVSVILLMSGFVFWGIFGFNLISVVLILAGIGCILAGRNWMKYYRMNWIAYERAFLEWNQMWFCKRCENFTQR